MTRLTITRAECTESLWIEIQDIAISQGQSVRNCDCFYLDVMDIEPEVPSYEDSEEEIFHD
ncbi:MAG TPA: hypothetical protein ENH82_19445 [bacterium]|nr:hypothetical protein [bacterium]